MLKYFGTDGVRGVANAGLTPEMAFKLGRDGGYVLTKDKKDGERAKVLVSRDTRISGQMLEYALISGLLSVGIEVLEVGVITTPGLSYLVRAQDADAGVQISASHNPVEDNGIKFFGSDGLKLSDAKEEEIEKLIDAPEDKLPRPSAEGLGTVTNYHEGASKYLQFIENTLPEELSGIKVVIDGANGAASALISRLFADMGVDFTTIATHPDGLNINDHVGATHTKKLQEEVVKQGAQLGLAFDGDADRCIAVDENGNEVDGDHIMYVIGSYLADHGRLKKDTIVTTVMSNLGFTKALERRGLKNVRTQVGDRYVSEEMRANGYNLGGEQSGHVIISDYHNTGDGMLTGLHLLYVMKDTGKSLSELLSDFKEYPQRLINVPVKNKKDWKKHKRITEAIEKVEKELSDEGRIFVRPSGTQSLLRVMTEAPTQELADKYCEEVAKVVEEEMGSNK
ncbi:phosphoglucosamine mutase [Lactobacillus taiwanensis]|uniref:phosphoglucosamine mutase n=2 Tax=Lactobacillus taiwanensis TaxID=508451 RepID=UPI000B99C2BA|nr:phosphoglucosamine mutase [Lactobacillus taiwanensis]OYS19400.1 phosphoglucosamine mutase [Lactobacillus taiwanensis]OYS22408.1 phosphoglucosamine mutase [Lactobacillus taiwanensis]OYS22809.1 phosphoglucosamine mutase [Lactobacillus taiwanensis]OYS23828.1 phosphoglucosamine mutase [Lactobacillus taiwanensis]OYS27450.1 phosphoglucosamine mutase [Lactobacillus taiwanensis]